LSQAKGMNSTDNVVLLIAVQKLHGDALFDLLYGGVGVGNAGCGARRTSKLLNLARETSCNSARLAAARACGQKEVIIARNGCALLGG
jgi:hypothetical protein